MSAPTGYDPHRSVSRQLTEVRTVLNRARTALREMDYPGVEGSVYPDSRPHAGDDLADMRAALQATVTSLERWERQPARRRNR